MKLNIDNIVDEHKGKKCICVGHGPSLTPYLEKIPKLKNSGYTILGCNNWNEFYPDCPPSYWLNANTVDNSTNLMDLINKYKSIWVYADSVDLTDNSWIENNIQTDYLPYDQRHFNNSPCPERKRCCNFIQDRLTIQEELQKYTKHNVHYNTGDTVVLHMLAFAIIMGFTEINCVGLDFDYHLGYAKNTTGRKPPSTNYFDDNRYGRRILNDIKIISDSAKNINTKMINLNKNTTWKTFEIGEI